MTRRLIEEAFPLQKVSENSVHEKSVRHGHISTLHIWPARRPLAACRAALLAALLPDPGDPGRRQRYVERIAGVTRWGAENSPDLKALVQEIRAAHGGRAPRVLDPFAGGGAIPFEALRLGCEVTAVDYNPVAWFILKCTLDYPARLAGQKRLLPDFAREGRDGLGPSYVEGDLAEHVRAWGQWMLERARREIGSYYPKVDGKPTVAYLWARTIPCQDPACGAEVPLLRTLWLCRKAGKLRALRLTPHPEARRVEFAVYAPESAEELRDRGTMARTGVTCPCCGAFMRMDYVQAQARSGRLGQRMTAVVVDGPAGKEYRLPKPEEESAAEAAGRELERAAAGIPHGMPEEEIHAPDTRAIFVQLYGLDRWGKLFTPRQLLAMATFARLVREARAAMEGQGYPREWAEAVAAYLAAAVDRLADYDSTVCLWHLMRETISHTFTRFALPMTWDFAEANPLGETTGGFAGAVEWVAKFAAHALRAVPSGGEAQVLCESAVDLPSVPDGWADLIVTDPPYYDAIPYADLSDFFHVWLRRTVGDAYPEVFSQPLVPKEGELVQKPDGGGKERSKAAYEEGMARAFAACHRVLADGGQMVVVFAHKDPAAWETLVSAMIRAGFAVTASWPIDTELASRMRAQQSAALATSLWLVCEKRAANASPGRYTAVREAMRERVTERLRYFWDQGLSGPDFVWAAIGPALESYSRHPVVKRLDGSEYQVGEFLREVRRLVTDFALGRILHSQSTGAVEEWTRYYLMHRHSFGLGPAPAGECILLTQAYGMDLGELRGPRGILTKASKVRRAEDEGDGEAGEARGSASQLRLLGYDERDFDDLGEARLGSGLPYIDALHRLMRIWAGGKSEEAAAYISRQALGENEPFWAVAQAVLEMAAPRSRERSILEGLVSFGRGRSAPYQPLRQTTFLDAVKEGEE